MKEFFYKFKFLYALKDKPIWKGVLLNLVTLGILLASVMGIFLYRYNKDYIEPYAKQILEFPEFEINADNGLLINGDNFESEINGVMMVVNDDLSVTELIYEYADKGFDATVILGKDGMANLIGTKLALCEKYSESESLKKASVSDAGIKLMFLDAEMLLDGYKEEAPGIVAFATVSIIGIVYLCYGSVLFILSKALKLGIRFKEIINTISYTSILPMSIVFVYLSMVGKWNIWMMLVQLIVLIIYINIFKSYKMRGEKDNG